MLKSLDEVKTEARDMTRTYLKSSAGDSVTIYSDVFNAVDAFVEELYRNPGQLQPPAPRGIMKPAPTHASMQVLIGNITSVVRTCLNAQSQTPSINDITRDLVIPLANVVRTGKGLDPFTVAGGSARTSAP